MTGQRPSPDLLASALDAAKDIDNKLVPTLHSLQGINKALARMAHAKQGHTHDDIRHYQQMLDAIDSKRVDGVFGGDLADKAHIPAGQAQCANALAAAYEKVGELQETATDASGRVAEVTAALAKHVAHLKSLLAEADTNDTHAGFELKKVQGHLGELEEERVSSTPNGWGVKNGVVPPGQAAAQGLLEEAFELVAALHDKGA